MLAPFGLIVPFSVAPLVATLLAAFVVALGAVGADDGKTMEDEAAELVDIGVSAVPGQLLVA